MRFKPVVKRDYEFQRALGLFDSGCWVIHFPPSGNNENGVVWFARDCKYVRESIAAWYRSGLEGLSDLHRSRYAVVSGDARV